MIRIFLILIVFLSYSIALAEYCEPIGEVCTEGEESRVINGYVVKRSCWKYEIKYRCYRDEFSDYCSIISSTPGCELISHKCLKRGADGECDELEYSYKCGKLFEQTNKIILLDTEYTVTQDELDTRYCDEHSLNQHCALSETVCVEGKETRVINGYPIFKECWKYKRKYICMTGSFISDCKEHQKEGKKCALVEEHCLSSSKDGKHCYHKEKKYVCLKFSGKIPETKKCDINSCVMGECRKTEIKENKNMGKAIGYLSILGKLKKDFDYGHCEENPKNCDAKVFKGEGIKCEKHLASGLTKNCCTEGKGFLEKLKFMGCSQDEEKLAKAREQRLCHHVGDYCSKVVNLGFAKICWTKKQSHCCFQSKISRILQQQGRKQLGIGWGSPESPDCRALSLEEIKRIDFSKLDLTEVQNEIKQNIANNLFKHNAMPKEAEDDIRRIAQETLQKKGSIHDTQNAETDYKDEIARRIRGHYADKS